MAMATTSTVEEVTEWIRECRGRTIDLVADLNEEQMVGPRLATVNPLIWEIGHLAWFQESFVLRQILGRRPQLEHADALWDSSAIPHDTRWFLVLPPRSETVTYMRETAERVARSAEDAGATDVLRHMCRYTVHHEDWHTEAITYTRQTLGYPAPRLPGISDSPARDAVPGEGPLHGDARVPSGTFLVGALRSEPFVFDSEKWAHPVELGAFQIARAPVTQAEFAAFVDDGGYRRREFWGDAGWAWRVAVAAEAPLQWRRTAEGWERRDFDSWALIEPHRPAIHVNCFEAEAYCRWAGRRLPTEAEWEAAAIGEPGADGGLSPRRRAWPWGDEPLAPHHANVDWRHMRHVDVGAYPAGDSAFGCRQMIGNVWEWTSSIFGPYPGFERDAYQQNSEPWFGTRRVLRGGAWASRGRLLRGTLRNYFTPDRRDVFAGFRTVAPD